MDKTLKKILVAGGVIVGGAIIHHNKKKLEKKIEKYKLKEPWDTLMYVLSRPVVICPSCDHTAAVKTLDAQLQTQWECNKCSAIWVETSHCDVIIKEGRK